MSALHSRGARSAAVEGRPGHDHAHHRVPRAALIALVPLAVLAVLRPPALDAGATDSVAPAATQPQYVGVEVQPLPGDPDTPTAISFDELSTRANAGNGPVTLQNRTLELEGFVAKSKAGAPAGTIRVGRYKIWCCGRCQLR